MSLTSQEWLLVGIIAAALIAIASGRVRPDLVAILVLVTLPVTGIIESEDAFSGFSRSVVITIIGLFMMTQALEDTGVVTWIARRLRRVGGGSEVRLIVLFMTAGAVFSLVMNNIAAGAVLLPAAVQVGRESKVSPSKLLIPLSFGTLVGGMATYFTTANIILSSILSDQGQPRLSMLDFVPTGSLIIVAGLVFMVLIGRRLLPNRESVGQATIDSPYSLYETYELDERLWDVYVPGRSRLANQPLGSSQIGHDLGLTVIGIRRGPQFVMNPSYSESIRAGDHLLVLGREERVQQMAAWGEQVSHATTGPEPAIDLFEIIIPPRSSVIGKTLVGIDFRRNYALTVVALWRGGRSYRTDVGIMPLEVGDALLVMGTARAVVTLAQNRDFLVLQRGPLRRPLQPGKALRALLITILVVLISMAELIPTAEAMMIGAAAMVLAGCIHLDEAYRAIEWRVIFLIAGMLPISLAMVETGLAVRIGDAVVDTMSAGGPLMLITGLFLLTMVVTQVIGGQVAALIVGPIAITSALDLGVNPQAVAVAVAVGCSTAFLTPVAHPVNILMMGPGGYTFQDFVRVGLGMTAITFVTLLIGMIVFWGL